MWLKSLELCFQKKNFLSPDSALGFGSKLDAADAHRIHSSKKSPDAEEGRVEAESSPLTVCNIYERGGKTTREAFFIVCSKHPLFFHSPWLSYLSFYLWVGGRLQLCSLLLHELMMWVKSHRSSCVCGGNLFGAAFWVVNDSSFQELDRVSEERDVGAARGFQASTFLAFSGRWHLATYRMKAAGEFPYTAGLPSRLYRSPCFWSGKRLLSFELFGNTD